MRTDVQIRNEILKLRDLRGLPYSHMAENSRCSVPQIIKALKLEATEDILRKLDAYLDAKHLHNKKKDSDLIRKYEDLDRELYKQYGAKNLHVLTFQKMSLDQQQRMINAMEFRAKMLLQEKIQREYGFKMSFADGLSYWQCKEKARERSISLGDTKRQPRYTPRARPVGKSRFL